MKGGCLTQVVAVVVATSGLMAALPSATPEEQDFAALPQVPTPTASPTPEPTAKPKPTPRPEPKRTLRLGGLTQLTGRASWFDTGPSGPYAAACWPLRKAMGGHGRWRGETVLVVYRQRAVEVRLTDYCASHDKSIDLDAWAFKYLAPLSRGVLRVTVGW